MRIAMLLHKTVEYDSRVRREARALAAAGHQVVVLHLPREPGELDGFGPGFAIRSVTPSSWVRRLPVAVYRLVSLLSFVVAICRVRPDAVHAHDAAMLAPGLLGARIVGASLVYDSHEYAVGVAYRDPGWARGVAALERFAARHADVVVTVSDGIAARLEEAYGLPRRPLVVRNLPDPAETDAAFDAPDLRNELGLAPETPLVLHLGAVSVDRGCESLVRAMADLPDAHLLFLGSDDSAYAAHLRELAVETGVGGRVHFRRSVPVGQIRAHTRQATVGVSLLEDTCENHRLALPNKVFEYLAAGVPLVVSDLPELRALVESSGRGTVADPARPDDVALGIAAQIAAAESRQPGDEGAWTAPAWSEDAGRLLAAYQELSAVATTG